VEEIEKAIDGVSIAWYTFLCSAHIKEFDTLSLAFTEYVQVLNKFF